LSDVPVVWLTGLPGSGKSTLAQFLKKKLLEEGYRVEVLESDAVRKEIIPHSTYSEKEREVFYHVLIYMAKKFSEHQILTLVDATANKRIWREKARKEIPFFIEVYVKCSLSTCEKRDPKGIYKKGREGVYQSVPGLHVPYEEPRNPNIVIDTEKLTLKEAQEKLWEEIKKHFIASQTKSQISNSKSKISNHKSKMKLKFQRKSERLKD
jgi:adenylylsulfate kinase